MPELIDLPNLRYLQKETTGRPQWRSTDATEIKLELLHGQAVEII